jgi:hypothetical protein
VRVPAAVLLLGSLSGAAGWTVCLDPGHGGSDPGASGAWYLEKTANLDVAWEAAYYLELVSDCDWVGMTRTGDYDVSLQARCDYANQNGFDRFMCIHENAFDGTVQGSETYCDLAGTGFDLAARVLDGIIWAHGYPDRGVKDGTWLFVIANTTMPSILGEGTFIDYDVSWDESYRYFTNWNDHEGRQGWAYAAGLCEHLGSTPPAYGYSGDIIVDNLSAGFTVNSAAEWSSGSYGDPWGTDYRWSTTTNQSDWARWTPDLAESGWYEVYLWYVEGSNRAQDAIFSVHHEGGDTQFIVDQTQDGEQWNLLGGFGFEAGASGWVTLSEIGVTPGKVVIADAIRFHLASTGMDEPASMTMPGALPGISVSPNPSSCFLVSLFLPCDGEVSLDIYDMSGRHLDTVSRGYLPAGESIIPWNPEGFPAAVYIIRASAGSWSATTTAVRIE